MGLGSISSFREAKVAEDRPDDWVLEAWYPGKPGKTQNRAVASLFCRQGSKIRIEKLPDADWLVGQQEVEPIRRAFPGPGPEFPPSPAAVNSVIPRSPSNT